MWPASESASRGRAGLSLGAGMDYLPVFLRLHGECVVVVGGGQVALRKALWLRRAGAHVTVVAPHLHPELGQRVARGELTHIASGFSSAQLAHAVAVVAATDDRTANAAVAAAARERRVPVNVVDDAELSSFIFPAIIDRSPIVVAVSSAGHSPVLARRVREQIEALLPERLGALARFMGARREALRRALAPRARRALWERVASGPVATHVLAGDEPRADRALARELLASRLSAPQAAVGESLGEVYLIGAGPGDPDLLTLRALQLLQRADVILYDRLVSEAVLERARRDAERICVGKTYGDHGQQEHIHELLVRLAGEGKRVARLKGGDPFVFGRGGEEIEVLAAHGIPYTVVPGITAALGAAAAAELPLTHRRLASSVTFVNGHAGDAALPDWRFFANPRHTVVVYMGVAQLPGIIARLRAAGAASGHPVAIIERATLPEQRILRGTLADIMALAAAQQVEAPALLIVGDVAAFTATDTGASFPEPAAAAGVPA
jgi:uroporphyrin-III C-methyltransferase / precorrin-2 dehydrogenase / sirohydrochlorin ferrochelatase